MDFTAVKLSVIVLFVHLCTSITSGVTLRKLDEKVEILEARLNVENTQRHKDYEMILSKLNDITTKLDNSEDRAINEEDIAKAKTARADNDVTASYMHGQILYLMKGMKEEKRLNEKMRRMLPGIEQAIEDINHRMKRVLSLLDSEMRFTRSAIKHHMNATDTNIEILRDNLQDMVKIHQENISQKLDEVLKNMSLNIEKSIIPSISSCYDAYTKGYTISSVYKISHQGLAPDIKMYCDQSTDGGGWTVFQRRMNGVVDFRRNWTSYKIGFGDPVGEFWLGNDHLSTILQSGQYELRIDMEDLEGNRAYAKYSSFRIDAESNFYTLHIDGYIGNAGDSLKYHNDVPFSTKDHDSSTLQCARRLHSAWWYNNYYCYNSILNGVYHLTSTDTDYGGMAWMTWKGLRYSLKLVEMKFRQVVRA